MPLCTSYSTLTEQDSLSAFIVNTIVRLRSDPPYNTLPSMTPLTQKTTKIKLLISQSRRKAAPLRENPTTLDQRSKATICVGGAQSHTQKLRFSTIPGSLVDQCSAMVANPYAQM